MTTRPDEDQANYRIRVDLPFISFSVGRGGWGTESVMMYQDDPYERARRRVHAKLSFYRNLAAYAAVVAAVAFLDLITGGGLTGLVLWAAGIAGALLVLQAFNVFVFPSVWSPEAEEKMIEEEMRKEQHQEPRHDAQPQEQRQA